MLRGTIRWLSASWRIAPEVKHFDVCVIGGGPAGIAATMRAVDYNKTVCLIENSRVGGCDLWNGALQSKTLWQLSSFLFKSKGPSAERLYGESLEPYMELDEGKMLASIKQVSETRACQIEQSLKAAPNVTVLYGPATFTSDKEVQYNHREMKECRRITASHYVIATGSTPRTHPFVHVDGRLVVTSDHIMQRPLPKSLVVIGAGVIGCEFASILAGLGKTKVSLIDKAHRILPMEDADVAEYLQRQMANAGVAIHHDSTLYDLQPWEETAEEAAAARPEDPRPQSGVQYTLMNRHTKQLTTYNVDQALLSIGRVPHYHSLGLENTSLRTRDGKLLVDDFGLCEGSQNIYAVGDAVADMQLVSVAEVCAKLAVDRMYSTRRLTVPRLSETMSSVGFFTQALASVGLNESECRRLQIGYIVCTHGYDLVSRAVAAANTDGFMKVIVSNDSSMTILGVRAIGMNASTLVVLGALAIQKGQTVHDLVDRLTAYPAVSQVFQECLRALAGRSEMKPGTFNSLTVTSWLPEGRCPSPGDGAC